MAQPLIAVIGSADPERQYDSPLRNVEDVPRASEELGRALAHRGCRLVVYSSDPQFIESHIVQGYLSSGQPQPGSIQVRTPIRKASAKFSDDQDHNVVFDVRPDTSRDWQVSFYRSLVETDGVILLGGGRSTFIAGLIALALAIPILPIATFGGDAERVWDALDRVRNGVTDEELATMAGPWTAASAEKRVDSLLQQRARKEEQRKRAERQDARYRSRAATSLTIAATFLILGLAVIPLVFALKPGTAGNVAALIATPLLVAPCGAIIRNVFDSQADWWRTAILGMVAGAVSGLLFILAQLAASPDLLEGDAARRLLLFLAVVGFIAGLTFDLVYSKLRSHDVLDTSALTGRQKML